MSYPKPLTDTERISLKGDIHNTMERLTGLFNALERDDRDVAAVGGHTPDAYSVAKKFYTTYHKLSECFSSYDNIALSWCDLPEETKQLWVATTRSLIHEGAIK